MTFAAGDRVTLRGQLWTVEHATAYADTTLLHLTGEDESGLRSCSVLLPFDRPLPRAAAPAIRTMSRRRWAHRLFARLAHRRVHGHLLAPLRAAIDLLPYQLEPALALVQGEASRVLIADEVGLGKTIQAGLMLAELRHRGWCDRALIATPAGLRSQWIDELQQRFGITAVCADAAWLAARATETPLDVNPWSIEEVAVASIDFLRQPEVLAAASNVAWDIFIVDEAHQATVGSMRGDAVRELADHARSVVLLSATPHAGDDHDYRALCDVGRRPGGSDIVVFRRTRAQTGLSQSRRVHLLPVAMAGPVRRMHRTLDRYVERLWQIARTTGARDIQLLAMVLAKRACSSPASLAISIERRLAGLGTLRNPAIAQPPLPFLEEDDSDDPVLSLSAAFEHMDDERDVLAEVAAAARAAAEHDGKLRALQRLLRRVREPVIVFTEYRDTLRVLAAAVGPLRRAALLHGGQSPAERRAAVAAFTTERADLLIATDAGSEGLNLQTTCRLVVNLELPWNPVRLEQRIGRVDRIGQRRTVHAINLYARDTAERRVLAALDRRLHHIRLSELEFASSVIAREPAAARTRPGPQACTTTDIREAAICESGRIAAARRTAQPQDAGLPCVSMATVPGGRRRWRLANDRGVLAFVRVRLVTAGGRMVEETIVPLHVPALSTAGRLTHVQAKRQAVHLLRQHEAVLADAARRDAQSRARDISNRMNAAMRGHIGRERELAAAISRSALPLLQAGLFDARAVREHEAAAARRSRLSAELESRLEQWHRETAVFPAAAADIEFLLFLC